MKHTKKYGMLLAVIAIIIGGLSIGLFDTFFRSKIDEGMIIAHDIAHLQEIFSKIHKDCVIIDFDAQKNPINFLNVKAFSGSEVGPMNVTYPEKWQGPYMEDNPTMHGIAYQVVSTTNGYFITPGDGIKLPNNKTIGTDIVLDSKANVAAMMADEKALLYKDQPLAARLNLGTSPKVQFFLDDEE